jgi:hypothetical protein
MTQGAAARSGAAGAKKSAFHASKPYPDGLLAQPLRSAGHGASR